VVRLSPRFLFCGIFAKKKNYGVKKKLGIFFSHHKLKKDGFLKLPLAFHFSTFIFVDFLFPKSLSNFFTLFLKNIIYHGISPYKRANRQ
jgi:hypothetical protein